MKPFAQGACPVLVFDSGVGGLSIVQAIRQAWPSLPMDYAFDNAAFPYGNKSEPWLIDRVERVITQLLEKTGAGLVVIACNTASTLALPRLRECLQVPVVGVVPAIKPAAQVSQTRSIALLATAGTVTRPYVDQLMRDFAADCRLYRFASAPLVDLAERALAGDTPSPETLRHILAPIEAQSDIDTIILGCTHFPLLKTALQAVAERTYHWVDSGAAVARRVGDLLGAEGASGEVTSAGVAWTTAPVHQTRLIEALATLGFTSCRQLTALSGIEDDMAVSSV